jgi:galactitol-specific phosphotransferase system IIC component
VRRVVTYGLESATDHSFSYLGRYLMLGVIPVGLTLCSVPWPGVAAVVGIVHFVSVALFFPGALVINALMLRVARRRTWDLQPWRSWVAAILGVALAWGSVIAAIAFEMVPPAVLRGLFGDFAVLLQYAGVAMTASSLSLVVAWALPPSQTKARRP